MLRSRMGSRLDDSVGLWSWYSFGYWASTQIYPITQHVWWLDQFAFTSISCLCLALCLRAKRNPLLGHGRSVDRAALAVGIASLALLGIIPHARTALSPPILLGVVCAGVYSAWSIVRWGLLYITSTAQENLERILVAIVAISSIKMINFMLPDPLDAALFAVVLVYAHGAAGRKIPTAQPATGPKPEGIRPVLAFWQTLLSVAIFFLIWSFLNMTFVTTIGHITQDPSESPWAVPMAQAIGIGFGLFMLWWTHGERHTVDWSFFWQAAFSVLALGLLTITLLGSIRIAQVFVSVASVLVYMFSEYLLIQLDRRAGATGAVIAAGFAVITGLDWAVRGIVVAGKIAFDETRLVPLLLFVILVTIVFFLPARSPGMQLLTTELSERGRERDARLAEPCRAVAEAFHLAAREADVLELLGRGRSTPYIAETLFLSENTVKTYKKRIYQKLGVHSKQELLDLIETKNRQDSASNGP